MGLARQDSARIQASKTRSLAELESELSHLSDKSSTGWNNGAMIYEGLPGENMYKFLIALSFAVSLPLLVATASKCSPASPLLTGEHPIFVPQNIGQSQSASNRLAAADSKINSDATEKDSNSDSKSDEKSDSKAATKSDKASSSKSKKASDSSKTELSSSKDDNDDNDSDKGKSKTKAVSFSGNVSWYGIPFHGRKTASGEIFDMNKLSAAHLKLPFQSKALVEDPRSGNAVIVRVNDRGPYAKTRVMDLSREAGRRLGILSRGVGYADITVIERKGK